MTDEQSEVPVEAPQEETTTEAERAANAAKLADAENFAAPTPEQVEALYAPPPPPPTEDEPEPDDGDTDEPEEVDAEPAEPAPSEPDE